MSVGFFFLSRIWPVMNDSISLISSTDVFFSVGPTSKTKFISYWYWLSEFLKQSLMIFIIKGFRTIVLIFIVNNKDENNSPKTLNDENTDIEAVCFTNSMLIIKRKISAYFIMRFNFHRGVLININTTAFHIT